MQKKKLSVAGIQLRAKKVLDSQADELKEEKKFIVKVNEDLDNVQSQLKEAGQQISQMLIGNVSMEDKVGYMQSLAAKMEKLKTLSYPLPNKKDDRIGGIGSMCPWGQGPWAVGPWAHGP